MAVIFPCLECERPIKTRMFAHIASWAVFAVITGHSMVAGWK